VTLSYAYLRRAVINELFGVWRRQRTVRRLGHFVATPGSDTDDLAGRVADRIVVWNALRTLPARQRTVLVLRYFEDLSEAEIAEVLRVSLGTVKSRAARALDRLRAQLGEGPHA
jgi:RNA polymerase sigma factor (sigma-70 family)